MKVLTAVIPVAGAGTRVFPSTTSIEKCMMPVYAGGQSRPIIDYMVEDCAKAGIERIIFVTSERGKTQLQDYFEGINANLVAQLKRLGKDDVIQKELDRRAAFDLTYEYIIQPATHYGTAFPPYLAKDLLKDEKYFALAGGDDFIYHQDGKSELAAAITQWEQSGADHVIMGWRASRIACPNYGILQINDEGYMTGFIEKPPLERVPENPVANISRYLFSDSIWPIIEAEMAQNRGASEHHITYAIEDALAAGQTFFVHPIDGVYMDGGSFDGLLSASQYISAHPRSNKA
jgi:UTP--glucose-1-phosphate uridylyltransferase